LVDVAYSGVCRTQLAEVRGGRGPDRFLPHALGHEGSGVVLAVGEGVRKVKPGDRVVLSWIKGKGTEVGGTVYQSAEGPINSGAICTFMRHTVTCENRVTPIPETMPVREAALLGCAVPTGCGIVLNTANVQPGESVGIFGAGGIGISAILGAVMVGATPIIAVDVVDYKLHQAREAGATHTIDASRQDALATIGEITGGRGLDYAIEAAGKRAVIEAAFKAVRDKGGLCVVAGNVPLGELISIDPFDLIRGKRIVGTWGGETETDTDIPRYVERYEAGNLDLGRLISSSYSLRDINRALDDLEQGQIIRALIDMSL